MGEYPSSRGIEKGRRTLTGIMEEWNDGLMGLEKLEPLRMVVLHLSTQYSIIPVFHHST